MDKPYIIFNPTAGSAGRRDDTRQRLKKLEPLAFRTTRRRGDAEKWARHARAAKARVIVVAGGDGTLNEVVNGLHPLTPTMCIGLVPLGTGNDFARTMGLPFSIEENLEVLRFGKRTRIDVVRVKSKKTSRYFVNVSAGGFSGIVGEKMTRQIKRTWGPLAYVRGAAAALLDLHAYKTDIALDDRERFSAELYNVVVANGRFVAGGLPIAPTADPTDGKLEVVLIPKLGAAEMALLAAEIVLGKHLSSNATIFRQARKIVVRSRSGMYFDVDGELVGTAPATFQIIPRALNFIVK
ncbi:MAG TPA: YegS/Rv2252/BmrU family lipid kinase [Chthoniobacterales bacterium]|nr:YegS/Rv2252/BmrU family lipid kinase [Chthoniobacterales bacterium]